MNQLYFLLGAGLMGILCGVLASRSGRNTWAWGICGFLFGLITLVVYGIVAWRAQRRAQRTLPDWG